MKPTFLLAPAALAAMAAPTAQAASETPALQSALATTEGQAVDYFLKIDGIEGESADSKHKGEIEIASFSWGAVNAGQRASGGGGAGKVSLQDFHFTAKTTAASPKLFLSCATGEHIKKATLTCRKAGGTQQEFLKIEFDDVLISSYQAGGAGGEVPTDSSSLNFAKIEFDYAVQRPDGSIGSVIKTGWDVHLFKQP